MLSIIIPAHNEEKLITATVSYLLSDNELQHCQILIICNACHDNTVEVMQHFKAVNKTALVEKNINFKIISITKASKTNALNKGVKECQNGEVLLLDADILVNGSDINILLSQLKVKNLLAASPRLNLEFGKSSFLTQQYFKVAHNSRYNKKHRLSNVIALTQDAIKRIFPLPEIIADDEYLRRQIRVDEYSIVDNISFDFICPKSLKSLLQVLTRVERGNLQLARLQYIDNSGANTNGFISVSWFSLPIFIFCKFYSIVRAKWQYKQGRISQWERDESNR